MLAIAFHAIPFGTPAWRINLLSVLLSTASSFLHFLTIVRWDTWLAFDPHVPAIGKPAAGSPFNCPSIWAGLVGSGLLAFCPLVWMYSIQAEVFAMNNFFVALILFLTGVGGLV